MATRGRREFQGATIFFVTTTLKNFDQLFDSDAVRDEVTSMLFRVAKNTKTSIMGYCVMSSLVHIIAGHNDGGPGISKFMQSFKSLVSHMLFKERHGIWMPRFDEVIIASENTFVTKLNYIHENPVRSRLVAKDVAWRWSSARFWKFDEPSDALTRTTDWVELRSSARRGRLASTSDSIA